jgi:hypothetical protein
LDIPMPQGTIAKKLKSSSKLFMKFHQPVQISNLMVRVRLDLWSAVDWFGSGPELELA